MLHLNENPNFQLQRKIKKKTNVIYKGILYFSEKEFTIAPNYNVDELHKYNIKQKRKIQYMYDLVEAQSV